MNDVEQSAAVQRRNRIQMVGIMMVGFVTLGASYLMFYLAQDGGGWGTTNNGEFVQPPVSTQQLGWQVEGDSRSWWLWMLADDCAERCQATVKDMRALHILLNREADRVRRGFTGPVSGDWLDDFPQMARVALTNRATLEPGVYIVDPNGNLVLFYPLDTEPKPVLQDLKKLLKVSQIG